VNPRAAVRIGTRGSRLALAQANWVKAELERRWPQMRAEVIVIVTSGDRLQGPLARIGGKGLFIKEIEEALLDGRVDLAVHSMKDLPVVLADGLVVAAVPVRADSRDLVVGPSTGDGVMGLQAAAIVGTTSLRRRAQLLAARPDLRVVDLRGNVDTRLRKRAEGACDVVIVAAAGLIRLGIGTDVGTPLHPDVFVPAVGQGALALETRAADESIREMIAPLNDAAARAAVAAERAFLRGLGGDCVTPIAAAARLDGRALSLTGLVATPDGRELLRDAATGPSEAAEELGVSLAAALRKRGADEILARARQGEPAGNDR
jgi:hydroxymethylbilane synthase